MDKQQIFIGVAVQKAISERLRIDPSKIQWNSSLRDLGATVSDLVEIEMTVEEDLVLPAIDGKILRAGTVGDIVNAFYRRKPTRLERALRTIFGA